MGRSPALPNELRRSGAVCSVRRNRVALKHDHTLEIIGQRASSCEATDPGAGYNGPFAEQFRHRSLRAVAFRDP